MSGANPDRLYDAVALAGLANTRDGISDNVSFSLSFSLHVSTRHGPRKQRHNLSMARLRYHQTRSLGSDRHGCFCFRMGSRGTCESRIHFVYVCIWTALRGVLGCGCGFVFERRFRFWYDSFGERFWIRPVFIFVLRNRDYYIWRKGRIWDGKMPAGCQSFIGHKVGSESGWATNTRREQGPVDGYSGL